MGTASGHQTSSELPQPFPPRVVCILGAGRFGTIAAERLARRYPSAEYLVVDSRQEKLRRVQEDLGVPVREEDAISFLLRTPMPDDIWIIPAVPVHVAFQWMCGKLGESGQVVTLPVPESVDAQIPNPYRVGTGTLYASFATFICPDACNEPDEICTYTKMPRPGNLFEVFADIQVPGFKTAVVRSWQLAPGVGGYPGRYLREKLAEIARQPGQYFIATSCRCHGVIDGLSW